jgi:hypothetical protein
MRLAQLIRTRKGNIEVGDWNSGHIPRSSFPMSKARAKAYKFGKEYKWRIIRFTCGGNKYRVLILLNEGKEIYRATLAMEDATDLKVICQHEFHASEPGWHCHFTAADTRRIPAGVARPHLGRRPKADVPSSDQAFGVSEGSALSKAAYRYGFIDHGLAEQTDFGI